MHRLRHATTLRFFSATAPSPATIKHSDCYAISDVAFSQALQVFLMREATETRSRSPLSVARRFSSSRASHSYSSRGNRNGHHDHNSHQPFSHPQHHQTGGPQRDSHNHNGSSGASSSNGHDHQSHHYQRAAGSQSHSNHNGSSENSKAGPDESSSGGDAGNTPHAAEAGEACPFSVLGLHRHEATKEDVKKSYQRLAKEHHPDVEGGCQVKFRAIHAAYEQCKAQLEAGYRAPEEGTAGPTWEEHKEKMSHDQKVYYWDQRHVFRRKFEGLLCPDAIDNTLVEAIACGCFAVQDIGEPLSLALGRYHACADIGLGGNHIARCSRAIDTWEEMTHHKASNFFYHSLLILYIDALTDHCHHAQVDYTAATEAVTAILEKMTVKGLHHDDWTLTLANRAFKHSPFLEW